MQRWTAILHLESIATRTMKRIILISSAVLALTVAHGQTTCDSIGVENGWGIWQAQTSTNNYTNSGSDSIIWSSPTTPSAPRFIINSGSGDALCTPCAFSCPTLPLVAPNGFGNASIQIGQDTSANWTAEKLTNSFYVSPKDTNFIISYTALIQDAGHAQSQIPYTKISIKDQNGNPIQCGNILLFVWQLPGWFQSQPACNADYMPWMTTGINLAPYIGQSLSVEITNADCAQGGHWAQSFWDFQCAPSSPTYCTGQQITLCGGQNTNAGYTYQWYQNGNPIPTYTTQCISATPSLNDTFMVYVQQPSACNFYQTFIPLDTCLSAVNNFSITKSIKIFPNPFCAQTVLQTDNPLHNATLTVDNCYGQTVAQIKNISGQAITFTRDNLPSGLYFYKVTGDKGQGTSEVIATGKLVITDK